MTQSRSTHGIGGSEIAAACGISRYTSRFGLWLQKTGRASEFSGNVHTRLGTLCEPRARQLYSDSTGHSVATPPTSIFHPRVEWARATPDGVCEHDPGHLVQIKCVGYFVGRRWRSEGIPVEIEAQCQWEMFVTGAHRNDIAVLVGSDELGWERFVLGDSQDPQEIFNCASMDIYPIYRSDVDIETLLRGATEFMEFASTDTQPPIDPSPECARWLSRKALGLSGLVTIECDSDEIIAAVDEFRDAYTEGRALKRRLDLAKNRIRQALGDAGANRINTPDGSIKWISKSDGTTQLRAPDSWSGGTPS